MFAKFEGHDDPKNLAPWSQFFAAGMGGMISQYANRGFLPLLLYLT